eukprot:6463459-Amphidinium_carterae.1
MLQAGGCGTSPFGEPTVSGEALPLHGLGVGVLPTTTSFREVQNEPSFACLPGLPTVQETGGLVRGSVPMSLAPAPPPGFERRDVEGVVTKTFRGIGSSAFPSVSGMGNTPPRPFASASSPQIISASASSCSMGASGSGVG